MHWQQSLINELTGMLVLGRCRIVVASSIGSQPLSTDKVTFVPGLIDMMVSIAWSGLPVYWPSILSRISLGISPANSVGAISLDGRYLNPRWFLNRQPVWYSGRAFVPQCLASHVSSFRFQQFVAWYSMPDSPKLPSQCLLNQHFWIRWPYWCRPTGPADSPALRRNCRY